MSNTCVYILTKKKFNTIMSFYGSPVDKREKVSVEHVIRYIFCYPPPPKKNHILLENTHWFYKLYGN